MSRRFPAPWSYHELQESYAVRDATGFVILYVYFNDRVVVGTGPDRLKKDEARRIAANVAKLPELLKR